MSSGRKPTGLFALWRRFRVHMRLIDRQMKQNAKDGIKPVEIEYWRSLM